MNNNTIYVDYVKIRNYFDKYEGKKYETNVTLIFRSDEDDRWELFYNKEERSGKYKETIKQYALYLYFSAEDIEDDDEIDAVAPFDILNLLFDIKDKLTTKEEA